MPRRMTSPVSTAYEYYRTLVTTWKWKNSSVGWINTTFIQSVCMARYKSPYIALHLSINSLTFWWTYRLFRVERNPIKGSSNSDDCTCASQILNNFVALHNTTQIVYHFKEAFRALNFGRGLTVVNVISLILVIFGLMDVFVEELGRNKHSFRNRCLKSRSSLQDVRVKVTGGAIIGNDAETTIAT